MRPPSNTTLDLRRKELARELAERGSLTKEEAQDELDRVVHGVIQNLRRAGAAEMPGIGKLTAKRPGRGQTRSGSRSKSARSRSSKG